MSQFRFDPLSFLGGFLVGTLLAWLIYRLRHWIAGVRRQAAERAESARQFATRTADARYQLDILNYCRRYHIAGDRLDLAEIAIEPRFIPGVKPYDATGEQSLRDVFRVVPMIPEFPACYAPFNIHTLGISDLGAGERHLTLLGRQGSGRSTALAAIALWAMGRITFAHHQAEDVVQEAIDREEAQLSEKERLALRQQQAEMQARALEQIRRAQEETGAATDIEAAQQRFIDLHRLMPILVHLNDIVVDPQAHGSKIDPAEPLVRAIQHNVRRLTALTVPRYVYNRLNSGQALVLIDGLDDLPEEQRPQKLAWLRRFLETYPHCFVIVAGPATGFHPLAQLGLTPLFLRPWTDRDAQTYAQKWAAAWPRFAGSRRKPAPAPDEREIEAASTETRGLSPLDLTMRILATYSSGETPPDRWSWYEAFVAQRFRMKAIADSEELADEALYAVAEIAVENLAAGAIPLERISGLAGQLLRRVEGEGPKAKETFMLNVDEFVTTLTAKSGLMVERIGRRYDFRHPLLSAFLASATLLDPEKERTLVEVVADPAWEYAIPFAITHAPVDMVNRAVVKQLSQQPDLLLNNLFSLAHWLPDAPLNAPWRGEVFKRFAAALIAPAQFPVIRERALAALATTRDKNILFILRQALRSTDPHVRTLGCIGLGVLGEGEAIKDLRPMLEDEALEVQLAAGLALGAIGSERAIQVMEEGLLYGEQESLRQAVAEALAAIPGEGHQILYTGMHSEDMMVRRAAVFGLARLDTTWALTELYRALLEDDQWYVRSAAEQAFAKAQTGVKEVAQAHPPIETVEWVVDWAREHGLVSAESEDGLTQDNALRALVRMLESGEQPYRIAAARTLAILGYVQSARLLYRSLGDSSEQVRGAAYAALADLQERIGEPLPGVL